MEKFRKLEAEIPIFLIHFLCFSRERKRENFPEIFQRFRFPMDIKIIGEISIVGRRIKGKGAEFVRKIIKIISNTQFSSYNRDFGTSRTV